MIRDSFITLCKINSFFLLRWRTVVDIWTKEWLFSLWNTHCKLTMLDKLWNQYSDYYTRNTAASSNGTWIPGNTTISKHLSSKHVLASCSASLHFYPLVHTYYMVTVKMVLTQRATLQSSQLYPVSWHLPKSAGGLIRCLHPWWWNNFWQFAKWPFFSSVRFWN
jgi:hypothetical protein